MFKKYGFRSPVFRKDVTTQVMEALITAVPAIAVATVMAGAKAAADAYGRRLVEDAAAAKKAA